MGDSYEYLIKKFADLSKKNAGEFYTPRSIVKLMVMLLAPKAGESVYDPACGSAGMLISAIAYLKNSKKEWRNVSVYGQEINALTSAIGRMNLFLHGIKDFEIINDDTLKNPGFIEDGKLQVFDLILANPPYSIKQWDRETFATDKFGRNILGTPPQGCADFAFFQHIIKSMDPKTGRCAILFPHGILSRNAEKEMRKKLLELDLIESVIGIGKNLFFNSPMEACIIICRMNKPKQQKNKILFINAKDEVTRENAQSYLDDNHISKIANTYLNFESIDGFSKVATLEEVVDKNYSLGISLYVLGEKEETKEVFEIEECITDWLQSSASMHDGIVELNEMLTKERGEENS